MLRSSGAIRERQWGRFPALRQALEDKTLSQEYFGWCSVSDNIFDSLPRVLKIGMLARDNSEFVSEAAHRTGWNAMRSDLERLVEELESASRMFQCLKDEVRALHHLEQERPR
jgi:hypothetical protein